MKFNIAHLDKVLLIQTLYLHAEPKGYGEIEYLQLLESGEIVEGMSTPISLHTVWVVHMERDLSEH